MGRLKTALLLSYICIASISAAMITPALPAIEKMYALSYGQIEWVISIFLLGYVIGQLIYAPISNRFGRLKALRFGLLLNLIGILICWLSVGLINYKLLLAGRLITALGAASGLSCTFILINELLPPEKARHAMSFAIVSFTLGIGLSVSIGGMITQYLHWQDCFTFLLIHGALMLALTWQFQETLKEKIPLHPITILLGYSKAIKQKELVVFSLVIGFVSSVGYCYSAAAPHYALSALNLTPDEYGYWNLINMVGMLSSGLFGAHVMKKYGPKHLLYIGFGFMIPCIISLYTISIGSFSSPLWFFITTMLMYFFSGLLFPAGSYYASNAISDKASASSMMSFINMGSAMLAVVIMGYLPTSTVLAFALTLTGFLILILLLTAFRVSK